MQLCRLFEHEADAHMMVNTELWQKSRCHVPKLVRLSKPDTAFAHELFPFHRPLGSSIQQIQRPSIIRFVKVVQLAKLVKPFAVQPDHEQGRRQQSVGQLKVAHVGVLRVGHVTASSSTYVQPNRSGPR